MDQSISAHVRSIRCFLCVFFLLAIGLIGFTIWTHFSLPGRLAVHFEGAGTPDRWSVRWITLVMLAIAILYTALFGACSIFFPRITKMSWKFLGKEHWLTQVGRARLRTEICRFLLVIGIVKLVLTAYVVWFIQARFIRSDYPSFTMSPWMPYGVVALGIAMMIRIATVYGRHLEHPAKN